MSEVDGRDSKNITLWDIAEMITSVNEVLSDMMDLYTLQFQKIKLLTEYVDETYKTLNAGKKRKK